MQALNRHWIREVDRRAIEEYGMSGLVLMENAARGAVDVLMSLGCRGPVMIVCGKGNNAGDGFAMARHLENRNVPVKVILTSQPQHLSGDAAVNYHILEKCGTPIVVVDQLAEQRLADELANAEWIIDALLGTGSTGEPRPPLDRVISSLNHMSGRKLAIDLPSGLDCDTGAASATTFKAEHTVTFVAPKPGLLANAAQPYVGKLHVVDIGAPRALIVTVLRLAAVDPADR